MKAVICDECKTKAELGSMEFLPTGWVTIVQHHATNPNKERHFCSTGCVIMKLSQEQGNT